MGGRGEIGRRTGLKIPFPSGSAGSSPAVRTIALLTIAAAALSGCGRRPDDVPVQVSVIDAAREQEQGAAADTLRLATAQGLVRFDAAGGIEPGLAERWIVIDDGRSYIFRLADLTWPDGKQVTASAVVEVLKRAMRDGDGRLAPYLSAIDEIVAMTPLVIEVRLKRPRPDLLKLFAQPELAVPARATEVGSGPFTVTGRSTAGTLLRPADDPSSDGGSDAPPPKPQDYVRVRQERASAAVLRFAAGKSDLVTGGSYLDWPVAAQARLAPTNVRTDAAAGLFGFAVARRSGLLADAASRAAIALAIDRSALLGSFREDWVPTETLLPERLESAAPPAVGDWTSVAQPDRQAVAAARVADHIAATGERPLLHIALPAGPGATLVYGQVGAALRRIGIMTDRVAIGSPDADLRLVDAVAPYDSARWYLRTACQPCAAPVAALIGDVREAPDMTSRGAMLARADAALAADVAFIPIARPLRWSLVAARLRSWTPNARAIHPLNHLRRPPN